ncbi:MAG: N-acetylmuramoyl-L-alanine amidase [Anaerolineales bacterium]|nr:N-acetylmuramoyl-L-alanine amidase [Anaerolineales bacterium]
MKSGVLWGLSLLALLFASHSSTVARTASEPAVAHIDSITLTAVDLADGRLTGLEPSGDSLQISGGALTAVYTSPPISAPFAFNALVPAWTAVLPEGASLDLQVRTAATEGAWSDWLDSPASEDWTLPEDERITGDMVAVPEADGTHQFVQVRVTLSRDSLDISAGLQDLRLTFIDSTDGPTIAEMQAQQAELDGSREETAVAAGYPRPAVISRAVWCIYDTCSDTSDLYYEPVTHLIVHHTVTDNGYADAASIVRAIYLFHRDTQGWGDIGYNYLIDRNGVIFEGHMSEDYLNLDVVGIHASSANSGSMGTALIGTFTTPDEYQDWGTPTTAMLNSLANLFAWKADQRGIEIYDASRAVNMAWGLPHIMGHRDVYGGTNTLCPGGNAHAYLPWLRTAVAQRIGQVSPFTFVSETSSAFTRSNAVWWEAPGGCGWQGHAYYTWSTTNPAASTHWGEWRFTPAQTAYYEIQVYAPYCDTNNSETQGARYEVRHDGITETAVVSHEANVGLWISLGAYHLTGGQTAVLRLTDLTTSDSGVGVWFDDIRYRLVTEADANNLSPANGRWATQRTVNLTWVVSAPPLVTGTTLEISTTPDFSNILVSKNWPTAVTSYSHTFGQDYPALYWRVRLSNTNGVTTTSPTAEFGLDSAPPMSSVSELRHHVLDGYFDVLWQGTDPVSGIDGYTVQYRAEGEASWTDLVTDTLATTAVFTPTNPATLYWFRSQAVDKAGNAEAPSGGDIRSDQATLIYNPQAQVVSPASGAWLNHHDVTFSWQLSEIDNVQSSTVQVATDNAFAHLVASGTASGGATSLTVNVPQDGLFFWRVTVNFTPPLPGLTSSVTSAPGSFGLDTTPPVSAVTAVYTTTTGTGYVLVWQGQDNLSGAVSYTVDYRAAGAASWTPWLTAVNQTAALFTPPNPGQIYSFRSQARDRAGNLEAPHVTADISTDQAIPLPHAIMLPIIQR